MVFKAIVYRLHRFMWIKLISSPLDDINESRTLFDNGFFIRRHATFEIDGVGLYLPGTEDFSKLLPRCKYMNFYTVDTANRWLERYAIAYKTVNGEDAIIFDVEKMTEPPEYEDAPDVRLA